MANWRLLHTMLLQAQSYQKAHLSFYVYMHHFRVLLNAYVLFLVQIKNINLVLVVQAQAVRCFVSCQ